MKGFTKFYIRSRQALVSIFQRIQILFMPKVITGPNSILSIKDILLEKQIKSVLVVTTGGFVRRGTLNDFFNLLSDNRIKANIFSEVLPDPDVQTIEKAATYYRKTKSQAIIAIGGGSVMDTAKITGALVVKPHKQVHQLTGTMKIMRKLPLLIAVPTTAGSGSEVSAGAVITDIEEQRKYPIMDLSIIPKFAILDPMLLAGLPPTMTANSGMDALTHAVEAYINHFGSKASKKSAKQAVELIFSNLYRTFEYGEDLNARENMLLASYNAGVAFTNAYVGYVHAISHGIGGLYHTQHGLTNAVLLPIVLKEFGSSAESRLAELAVAIGLIGNNNRDLSEKFIHEIEKLRESMLMPDCLPEIKNEDVLKLAQGAQKEGNPTYPVPEIWNQETFERIIRQVMIYNDLKC